MPVLKTMIALGRTLCPWKSSPVKEEEEDARLEYWSQRASCEVPERKVTVMQDKDQEL